MIWDRSDPDITNAIGSNNLEHDAENRFAPFGIML
jgi:hypothetical protein